MSSIGILLIGVVSSLVGGAIFAAVLTGLAVGVYYELSRLTPVIGLGSVSRVSGYVVIVGCASLSLLTQAPWATALAIAIATLVPATMLFRSNPDAENFSSLVTTMALSAYVGLAAHAAIGLREMSGELDVSWANGLGESFTLTGESTALGMAWTMVAIAATWLADTSAFLIGRTFGKTPLLPHISPKKSMEGAAGAVLGSVIATVSFVFLFGIPEITVPSAIIIGVVFAAIGVYGDLFESFVKRSAGVKDSGSIIPGHGGIFDRLDSLFPTLLVAWIIASAIHT